MRDFLKITGLLLALIASVAAQTSSSKTPAQSSSKPQQPQGTSSSKAATPKSTTPAQTGAPTAPRKDTTAAWKSFCAPEGDYCVKYPPTWDVLGDTPDSGGIVIAPPQAAKPTEKWSSVTVAATDLPTAPQGKERPTFDEVITVVLESMQPGVQARTLERRQTTIDQMPAQLLKLQYNDEGQEWNELIALIDGDDVIYSMALRCTPQDLATLEPTFRQMLSTWKAVDPQQ